MEPFYSQTYEVTDIAVDRYGRMKTSMILFLAQEVAGRHCNLLSVDYDTLAQKRMFWAVTRHRVQITRLPTRGETITVETWPMPTTRVAYPRAMAAYDADGNELFRSISLWVLMDLDSRAMVLPGKSGVLVEGTLTGNELEVPRAPVLKDLTHRQIRAVTYSCLDRNGHMNNTRYLDWVDDLLNADFHRSCTPQEFVICYLSEARETEQICLEWAMAENGCLLVDAHREKTDVSPSKDRVFTAQVLYK